MSLFSQDITKTQLEFAIVLVALVIVVSKILKLDLEKDFWIASLRATLQLIAVGFALRWILGQDSLQVNLIALLVMTLTSAQAVTARLKKKSWRVFFAALLANILGVWPLGFISLVVLFPETAISNSAFFIPFVGVLLGNALSAISLAFLGLERVRKESMPEIETLTALGAHSLEACARLYRDLLKNSLTPILNGMTVVGIVSLPGVMAGQILGGVDPVKAADIQILIMILVLATSMFGSLSAIAIFHFNFMPAWLTKYSEKWAFDSNSHSALVLSGPSGSGKTRLLKSMSGLEDPSFRNGVWNGEKSGDVNAIPSGEANLVGVASSSSPQSLRPIARANGICYLHQKPCFVPGSVEDNLKLPFSFSVNADRSYEEGVVRQLFEKLDLKAEILARSAAHLSGGEAQLVSLVRMLQLEPVCLYLDEPTASLDQDRSLLVERLLKDWLKARDRRQMLVVTHNIEQMRRLADQILIFKNGRLSYE